MKLVGIRFNQLFKKKLWLAYGRRLMHY